MAPLGETVKNTAIVTWLFGGLVPALIAVNSFAFTKLSSPARYEGFVETAGDGVKLSLASLGAHLLFPRVRALDHADADVPGRDPPGVLPAV